MQRKIQPYSGPRGGHREEGKKMDTETKTQDAEESTKVPEGGIKRVKVLRSILLGTP